MFFIYVVIGSIFLKTGYKRVKTEIHLYSFPTETPLDESQGQKNQTNCCRAQRKRAKKPLLLPFLFKLIVHKAFLAFLLFFHYHVHATPFSSALWLILIHPDVTIVCLSISLLLTTLSCRTYLLDPSALLVTPGTNSDLLPMKCSFTAIKCVLLSLLYQCGSISS